MWHGSFQSPPLQVDCDFICIDSDVSFHPFKFYFPVLFVQGYCSLPDFFYEVVVIFGASYWVQNYLAVHAYDCCPLFIMVTCFVSITLSAFTIASCPAWLLVHLLSSLNLSCSVSTLRVNTATPDPTPCSLLLQSVNICHNCSLPSSFVYCKCYLSKMAGVIRPLRRAKVWTYHIRLYVHIPSCEYCLNC